MTEPQINSKTPEFRVSFAQVFEPKAIGNGKPKYSVSMLFDSDTDLSVMQAEAKEALIKKFGSVPEKYKKPFLDGNKFKFDGYEDKIVVRSTSLDKPGILIKTDKGLEDLVNREEFYSGCYAIATFRAFAWENDVKERGVSFGLQNLLKTRDGEPFSGKPSAEDDFADVGGDKASDYSDKGNEDLYN